MGNGFPIGACLLKKEVAEKIVQSQLVYVKACSLCNKNLQVDQLLHQKSEIFDLATELAHHQKQDTGYGVQGGLFFPIYKG